MNAPRGFGNFISSFVLQPIYKAQSHQETTRTTSTTTENQNAANASSTSNSNELDKLGFLGQVSFLINKSTTKIAQTKETSDTNATKNSEDLEKLGQMGEVNFLINKGEKHTAHTHMQKEIPREGGRPNPFATEYETKMYNEHNFDHGRVVTDPFKYRYKNPWLKYIIGEWLVDVYNRFFCIPDPNLKPDPNPQFRATHLKQGNIGDCWLIASIATIALKRPEIIRSLIKVDEVNNRYIVNLVDGREPVTLDPSSITSCVVTKTGAAWAGILEAAVARAIGEQFYKNFKPELLNTLSEKDIIDRGLIIMNEGNHCSLAIYYLTGLKTSMTYLKEDKDYVFKQFLYHDKLIMLGNHKEEKPVPDAPEFDEDFDGIVSGHAYALLEQTRDDLFYLFNPWGQYEPGTFKNIPYDLTDSDDGCNDGMFSINRKEFINQRDWTVYTVLDEPAKSLKDIFYYKKPLFFDINAHKFNA